MQGTTLGLELVQELKTETRAISNFLFGIISETDESFKKVEDALDSVHDALDNTTKEIRDIKRENTLIKDGVKDLATDVDCLKFTEKQHSKSIETVQSQLIDVQANIDKSTIDAEETKKKIGIIEDDMQDTKTHIINNREELQNTKSEMIYTRTELEHAKVDISKNRLALDDSKMDIAKNKIELAETKADVTKNRTDINELTTYLSSSRPSDKVFFYPPNRISTFVGREDELEVLQNEFFNKDNAHHIQVICGLGGIGKTALSVEFSWKSQSFYPGGVFWMSAESNEALEDSLQRLAIDIHIVGKDARETMHKTLRWLSSLTERWLLVIDNVDVEEIRGNIKELVLGAWKRTSKGHIVITSRREAVEAVEDFQVKAESALTLDVLSVHESKIFMTTRSGIQKDINDDTLELLIGELGGLPLALEQAAAHIKTLRSTFKEYLNKFNRQRLKLLKSSRSHLEISKERQAVRTTWLLNLEYISKQSEDDGLGSSAVTVMEVLAFLYADEIPLDIFNIGSPKVCDDDLCESLQDEIGVKQIAEILARFSLFQRCSSDTLSVHRLVQEVIRDSVTDTDHKAVILQCATRMINKAMEKTRTPNEAVKDENIGKTSLKLWSKLALHANVLKTYLFAFTKVNPSLREICFNSETAILLQASAIYHSLFQRQDEALASQDQMLSIIAAIDIETSLYRNLTCIKIPLLSRDRLIIQSSITTVTDTAIDSSKEAFDAEIYRKTGNEAFKLQRYQEAIHSYTAAIKQSCESVDPKLLSNRSLAYLKVSDYNNALIDAEKCIKLDTTAWKAYCWKAHAIAGLIQSGQLSMTWKSVGLAAASCAGYINSNCLLDDKMKIEYPVVNYKIIENEKELEQAMNTIYTNITFLLRRGEYSYIPILESSRIIGIENDVKVCNMRIIDARYVYIENITFPTGSEQVVTKLHTSTIFYRCTFSNGRVGCIDFPDCKGENGCANTNPNECKLVYVTRERRQQETVSGTTGYAGIVACDGADVLIDTCVFDRCGGGGTLCDGIGSVLEIRKSELQNMRQTGAEARNGGYTIVRNCTISNNQFHGVVIGPRGNGIVSNCVIQGNAQEGIWCGGILTYGSSRLDCTTNNNGGSSCTITDNIIYQNGRSGLSLDGGSYSVSGNRIFENWYWGLMIKSRSTTSLCNNDIFENKCGGIRLGINYSASVVLDGNTIRDHTGPGIHTEKVPDQVFERSMQGSTVELMKPAGMIDDESTLYTLQPFVTSRNIIKDNDKGQQHPQTIINLLQTCAYCHTTSGKLKSCNKCRKACYCSKMCQSNHWKRHKHMCKLLHDTFTIKVEMSKTQTVEEYMGVDSKKLIVIKTRNAPLPGLGQGTPPSRSSNRKFIVKIQSGGEYRKYDPNTYMRLYDQTQKFDVHFRNQQIYHLVIECGLLAATRFTVKKMFCWASFEQGGLFLCIHTENLPPFQTW